MVSINLYMCIANFLKVPFLSATLSTAELESELPVCKFKF